MSAYSLEKVSPRSMAAESSPTKRAPPHWPARTSGMCPTSLLELGLLLIAAATLGPVAQYPHRILARCDAL